MLLNSRAGILDHPRPKGPICVEIWIDAVGDRKWMSVIWSNNICQDHSVNGTRGSRPGRAEIQSAA